MNPLLALLLSSSPSPAARHAVTDVDSLRQAVAAAVAGDTVVLGPGTYRLDATLTLSATGTADAPITLVGEGATVESDTTEALKVTGAHWHIQDLVLQGVCASDSDCEHALHIVGAADGTWVRGCTLVDFNAQIKGNGEDVDGVRQYPDDVVIEGNDLHDTRARDTANPVTKIDVVGGRRWRVEANRISDFQKGGGDTVSYAAFLKGNSMDGVFARNLVVCSEHTSGGVRVGLSLGGGGSSPDSICEEGTCTPEHQRGTLRNNLIVHCGDVGIYLNEAADSVVLSNTLHDTAGIDVRFEASTVRLANNLLDGPIRERDGGTATLGTNWTETALEGLFSDPGALDFTLMDGSLFVDRGDPLSEVVDDFCGQPREMAQDGGALEYVSSRPCDTSVSHPATDGGQETGGPQDTEDEIPDSGDGFEVKPGGCGCGGAGGAGWGTILLALLAVGRRQLVWGTWRKNWAANRW